MESVMEQTSAPVLGSAPKVTSLVDKLMTIHQGTRNGYYEILADHGSLTYPELAALAGTSADVAKDWLEAQASIGVLLVDARSVPAWDRRYQLPAARAAFLLELEDPFVAQLAEAA